jgi:tetratricopeptide (TPR) repeat protein
VGGLGGLAFAFARWRRRSPAGISDDDRAVVAAAGDGGSDEELAFLLRSIDDLDRERAAGDLAEDDWAALRDDYVARAAARLRAVPVAATAARPRPWLKPAAAVAAVAGLAAGSGVLVARSSGTRLPNQPAAGGITETGPSGRLAQARALIGERKVLDAIKVYDQVLATDPRNAEALAYRGWLVRLTGKASNDPALIDKGLSFVERAVVADPSYPDARFFKGEILLRDKGDAAGAIPEFRAFLASNAAPDMATLVEGELRAALEAAGQS